MATMNVTKEIVLSILSLSAGAIATWIGLARFQSDSRERLFTERKAQMLAEENIKFLRRDVDNLESKIQLMLEKMDVRCDALERNQIQIQVLLRGIRPPSQ